MYETAGAPAHPAYGAPVHPSYNYEPPAGLGYPAPAAPARHRSATPWLAAVLVVVPILLAGAALMVLGPDLVPGRTAEPVPAVASPFVAPAAAPPSTPVVAPAASAEVELASQVVLDGPRVAQAAGYWVPQLSSKKTGTTDNGIVYDSGAILAQYRGLAAQYPDAALLRSEDWPVFRNGGYWVVVVAQPFSTADGANSWCAAQGFGPDDCFAKKLSYTSGPEGTTAHR
ncbi:hypothetical protein [Pseudonocardia phyllosphaerae]|uniref:hypothetical protein n=1 Tax=Pseudonocardia phyllosphaerae TaxID=3390502 RepID=UPI003979A827